MNAPDHRADAGALATLRRSAVLEVRGDDARAFLHAQLTANIERLDDGHAALAGWCSAKGRLLASFLVIPHGDGFLLQLAADLLPAVAKRLSMFVLRAKLRIADVSTAWTQLGALGEGALRALRDAGLPAPAEPLSCVEADGVLAVALEPDCALVLVPAGNDFAARLDLPAANEDDWTLAAIRAGRPEVVAATQDRFVPQMINFERIGGVDFRKGCYPGQEVVARAQYRGQVKRRMVRARLPQSARAVAGADLYCDDAPGQACGTVVSAAGGELLGVVPLAAIEVRAPIRLAPDGAALELLALPYPA